LIAALAETMRAFAADGPVKLAAPTTIPLAGSRMPV